jgi:AcrR family transcriptional regulator
MQRANGEVRRAQILAASGQLVRRRGFTATRMADVAAELGLSAPLIVYHFRTKDELMAATLAAEAQGELERLEAVAAAPLGPVAKLSRVVHLSLGAASVGDWALWIDAWGEGLRSGTMRDHLADLDRRWLAAIEAVIVDGQQAGAFTVPDPGASAERIMALLDGYGVQLVRAGSARARQRVLAAGRAAVGEELGVTLRTR